MQDTTPSLADLQQNYILKTSALFRLAVGYGCIIGGASQGVTASLDSFALHAGVAFQIYDDIKDTTMTSKQSGKDAHKDLLNHKQNYVSLLGLSTAKKQLAMHLQVAHNSLNQVPYETYLLRAIMDQLTL